MPFPTLRQRERGTGLAELVVASVLTVVTVTVGGFATSTLVQKGFHDFRYSAADSTHRALELALIRDSASAVAVFMPPTDTLGGQNCDANGNCHEIRIAVRSANHSTLTRIYRFDSSTNTVHVLESTVVSNANATDTGVSYTNIDKFSGLAVLASNASDPDLPGVSGTDVAAEMGSAQMIGGNGLVDVTIATDATERVVRLANSALDVADVTYNVIGTYYPPPPSFLTAGPNLVFSDSTQPPQTFSALENRYIGPFGVTACIDGLGRTLATITGGGDGPTETYSVTPVNRSGPAGDPGGVCTVIVTDDLGNSAPVQITVNPTRGALVVDPIIIQFSKPGDTNPIGTHPSGVTFTDGSGVFTATEPYYTGTFSITAGDTSGNNACGGTITFSQIAGSQWSSSSNAQTACYVTVHDDGQRSPIAVSVNSYAAPIYAIAPATQTFSATQGDSVNFTASSTLQNPGNVAPGTPSTLSIAVQNGSGPCSGWTPTSFVASGTTFGVTTTGVGDCGVNIIDTIGDTPASVVIVVNGPATCPPGYTGTPPDCVLPTPPPTSTPTPSIALLNVASGTTFDFLGVCHGGAPAPNCDGSHISVPESFTVDTAGTATLAYDAELASSLGVYSVQNFVAISPACSTAPCLLLTYPDGSTYNLTPSVGYGIDGGTTTTGNTCLGPSFPGEEGCDYDVSLTISLPETGTYTLTFATDTEGYYAAAIGETINVATDVYISQLNITTNP